MAASIGDMSKMRINMNTAQYITCIKTKKNLPHVSIFVSITLGFILGSMHISNLLSFSSYSIDSTHPPSRHARRATQKSRRARYSLTYFFPFPSSYSIFLF